VAELHKLGADDIAVICGGVIPRQDYDELYAAGASCIFGPGTPIADSAKETLDAIRKKKHK
jgi:methylmalonyl-CoA mutase